MPDHEKIDYIELPASDFENTQTFFTNVFGWKFESFGPDYLAFDNQGVDGGFYRADLTSTHQTGSALVIFYSHSLEATEQKIRAANGTINREIQHFPGGRRFHFLDPNGNEFAVWSDLESDGSTCN